MHAISDFFHIVVGSFHVVAYIGHFVTDVVASCADMLHIFDLKLYSVINLH